MKARKMIQTEIREALDTLTPAVPGRLTHAEALHFARELVRRGWRVPPGSSPEALAAAIVAEQGLDGEEDVRA